VEKKRHLIADWPVKESFSKRDAKRDATIVAKEKRE